MIMTSPSGDSDERASYEIGSMVDGWARMEIKPTLQKSLVESETSKADL